eukprot:764174-Hanusia_phi.AAC.1
MIRSQHSNIRGDSEWNVPMIRSQKGMECSDDQITAFQQCSDDQIRSIPTYGETAFLVITATISWERQYLGGFISHTSPLSLVVMRRF